MYRETKEGLWNAVIIAQYRRKKPIPVAALSKALVCGRFLAGIAGSNLAEGHGYLSVVSVVC